LLRPLRGGSGRDPPKGGQGHLPLPGGGGFRGNPKKRGKKNCHPEKGPKKFSRKEQVGPATASKPLLQPMSRITTSRCAFCSAEQGQRAPGRAQRSSAPCRRAPGHTESVPVGGGRPRSCVLGAEYDHVQNRENIFSTEKNATQTRRQICGPAVTRFDCPPNISRGAAGLAWNRGFQEAWGQAYF